MVDLTSPETLAFLKGLGISLVFVFLALYVYFALALISLAKKTETKHSWLAWIPLANIYLMVKVAGLSGWWILALLAGVIPFVGGLITLALSIWWWWRIAERVERPGWWGIIMIVPVVNLIFLGLMAWGEEKRKK